MLPGPHAVVGGLGDDDAGGGGERRRGCRLVMGLTYDALTRSFYGRLDYRTVGIIENCPARLRLSAGHRVSVVPQLGAVRAYLCGDFRDRGG